MCIINCISYPRAVVSSTRYRIHCTSDHNSESGFNVLISVSYGIIGYSPKSTAIWHPIGVPQCACIKVLCQLSFLTQGQNQFWYLFLYQLTYKIVTSCYCQTPQGLLKGVNVWQFFSGFHLFFSISVVDLSLYHGHLLHTYFVSSSWYIWPTARPYISFLSFFSSTDLCKVLGLLYSVLRLFVAPVQKVVIVVQSTHALTGEKHSLPHLLYHHDDVMSWSQWSGAALVINHIIVF